MIINPVQMTALSASDISSFADTVAEFLLREFPETAQVPRGELVTEVRRQIDRAREYGLLSERSVAVYVTTAWLLGTEFDTEFPAAQDVLTSEAFDEEEKVRWLGEWSTELFRTLESEER